VTYSTAVRRGDLVRIVGAPVSRTLLVALYREVLRAGGHARVAMTPDECSQIKLAEADDAQLAWEDPLDLHEIESVDVSINVWGSDNTKAASGSDPRRQAAVSQARRRFMARFMERFAQGRLRWVGTQFPCHSAAQDAEMSLAEYEDFVFAAGLLAEPDPAAAWREVSVRQQRMVDRLARCRELRFTTPHGTDLRLGVEGRTWINCDGRENFPDGEVFTAPLEDAVDGTVCYSFPAVHGGREVDGIRLVFRAGRVVEAAAEKGQEFLVAMLDQDEGARVLGEVAVGANYAIRRYTKNTLFDEKIGGTFHAALGAAYPESGGKNQSGLHWDMVCDLRPGGCIFADGELVGRDGRFLDPTWPQPG
jgi:aminopeptidase